MVPDFGWALVLSVPLFVLFSLAEPILRHLGEPAPLARDVGTYLGILRWGTPAYIAGLGILRAILPAIDQAGLLLRVTPAMVVGNGLLNYALIYGVAGSPAFGLRGSAIASTVTLWVTVLVLFSILHGSRRRLLVTPPRPNRHELVPLLRLGLPIVATIAGEVLMFVLAGLAAGQLGAASLAAHQIVLSIGTFTFMVPMAIGQAANVRVGLATGAGDRIAVRRAGLVAIGMAVLVMGAIGIVLLLTPGAGGVGLPWRPRSRPTGLRSGSRSPCSASSPCSRWRTGCRWWRSVRCVGWATRQHPWCWRRSDTGWSACRWDGCWRSGSAMARPGCGRRWPWL